MKVDTARLYGMGKKLFRQAYNIKTLDTELRFQLKNKYNHVIKPKTKILAQYLQSLRLKEYI